MDVHTITVIPEEWVCREEGKCGLLAVWCGGDGLVFPLNVGIDPDQALTDIDMGKPLTMKLVLEGDDIKAFHDEKAFEKEGHELASESCIPCGTFPPRDDDKDWTPSNYALIAGHVQEMEKCTMNGEPGYYGALTLSEMDFHFLIKRDQSTEGLKAGDILYGMFSVWGRFPEK